MNYTPFVWHDGADGGTLVDATHLNRIEQGIQAASAGTPGTVDAEAAGVTASGADVSASLAALLAGISAPTVVRLPSGTINLGTASFTIDVALVSLTGLNSTLTGTGTITLFSSTSYATRQANWGAALTGVVLAGVSLTIGSTTHTENGMFRISDGGMLGGTLTFGANCWKVALDLFHTQGTTVTMAAGTVNAGENMVWRDSMLTDGTTLALGQGDWHFDACSFDNMRIVLTAGAVVHMDGPHFEAAGGASARLLSLAGSGTACTITGGILVLNPGTGNWTQAPFFVNSDIVHGGLAIRGMQLPLQSYYLPETTDAIRVLVAGTGPATITEVTTYDGGAAPYALAESSSAIRNGGCEENGVAGWTATGTGTYSVDSTVKNRGTRSHKLTCGSGQTLQFSQDFPVLPGRLLWGQAWLKVAAATGTSLNAQVYFYDTAGGQISTTDFVQITSSTASYLYTFSRRIPAGSATARIAFFFTGGTGSATANIDDVIANVS